MDFTVGVLKGQARPRPSRARCAIALAFQLGTATAAEEQRWDFRDLYLTPAAWDSAYADLRACTEKLDELKTTLRTSAAAMGTALSAISDAQRNAGAVARLRQPQGRRRPARAACAGAQAAGRELVRAHESAARRVRARSRHTAALSP